MSGFGDSQSVQSVGSPQSTAWLSATGKAHKFHQPKYAYKDNGLHNRSPLGDGTFDRSVNFDESLTMSGTALSDENSARSGDVKGKRTGAYPHIPRRSRGHAGSLQVLGPGVWHSAAAQAAYIDLRPHQTFVPENRIHDDIALFGDVLDKRIDEDVLADASNSKRREVFGCSMHGPGKKKQIGKFTDVGRNRRNMKSRGKSRPVGARSSTQEQDLSEYW